MNVTRRLRNIAASLAGASNPLSAFIAPKDYRALQRAKPMTPGSINILGEQTRYSDKDGLLHSVQEIFVDEVYRFRAHSDNPHIIDAGANIGLSVRYFKSLYPKASVTAFEPDSAIFSMLHQNVGNMPGVKLRRAAAWVEDTTLTFYTEGSLAGSTEIDFLRKGEAIQVPAERLKRELARQRVDFLKIDIEGAENAVLFDIEDELENVDRLFFEYHSSPAKHQQLGDLLNLVARRGFRYVISDANAPKSPFVNRFPHGFDNQLNVSCFRDVTAS